VPATFLLLSRKLSRSGVVGILAIWATALILTAVKEPYAAATLYVTVICAAVLNVFKGDSERVAAANMIVYALGVFFLIEFAALYYWIGAALEPLGRIGILSEQLEVNLTFSLHPIAMLMLLFLFFSWAWPLIIARFPRLRNPMMLTRDNRSEAGKWNLRLVVASLDLFAILTVLIFFYLYLAGQTWIVGVDSYLRYSGPLSQLIQLAPSQAIRASYQHGLYLLLLYLIHLPGVSAFAIVKYAPLVLAFATASAVFLTIARAGWSFRLAVISSVCVLFWLPTTLGMYAGIQANWFAYLLWMLYLSFYFLKKEWNARIFIVQGLISLAILTIHPWTWGVFLVSLFLTALISRHSAWRKHSLRSVYAALVISLPVGIAAYQFLPGLNYDLDNTVYLYTSSIQTANLTSFLGAFGEMFLGWSSFLPPLLLLICLVGAYSLANREGLARNYLIAWIATWCVGSILIAPYGYNATNFATSETQLWRMLYLSPLPFLLALGIERVMKNLSARDTFGFSILESRRETVLFLSILTAAGAGLFMSIDPVVRLAIVLGAIAFLAIFTIRFPGYPTARVLVISILIAILVNAAYRSLYPLLIDPHNLVSEFSR
jgi:hypothetical protein